MSSAIVVVAKCPVPGHCKTRLIPMLGPNGAARLARAMLSDVVMTLSHEFALMSKFLLYAPPTDQSRSMMAEILFDELGLDCDLWTLIPVDVTTEQETTKAEALDSQQLTPILTNALIRVREIMSVSNNNGNCEQGPIVFLGMDSPQLNLEELKVALQTDSAANASYNKEQHSVARLCPCPDGGYGMISIPASAKTAFRNVLWSHPLTALSQIKTLTDAGVCVRLGRIMYDIDEEGDVKALCQRLRLLQTPSNGQTSDEIDINLAASLELPSCSTLSAETSHCPLTLQALKELGVWDAFAPSD